MKTLGLLVIGWLVGRLVGKVTKKIILKLKVDQYITRKKKPLFRLSDIFSIIFRWTVYLVFIWAAVETLGIAALTEFIRAIVMHFIPGLVKAIIVIIVGYALAEYVKKQVDISKVEYSGIIGNVLFWLIIYIAISMALPLIGIETELLNYILLIVIGSFGAGLAIAIGLGLKDTVAEIAKKYKKKFLK
ncbi:MAG: hypothetical protein ACE5J3_13010 [Methanosarcinales archaeon]